MASRFGVLVRQFSTSAAARGKLASAPLQVFGLEGRYAHALYSAATKEKKIDLVEKELDGVRALMQKDAQFADFIANPSIKRQLKRDAIVGALEKQKYSAITVNFFSALAENGRLKKVDSVLNAFSKIMSAHRGEVVCTVTTAKPLDAAHLKELKTALQGFMKPGESLQLETTVDPKVIGGMVVNIGDKYIDMSMQSRINSYTNLIKQAI